MALLKHFSSEESDATRKQLSMFVKLFLSAKTGVRQSLHMQPRSAARNGHGANHDDHNYLHGRYTPPPAHD
ncbi:unnamed protein product [Larinioides sclopetarius]|uniref:Uncharacterized protein n=1 Tax=Larinioides sclopetarius TaxID=280406 RepID=A0AAV2AAV4_9ARAC